MRRSAGFIAIATLILGLALPLAAPDIAVACVGGWRPEDLQSQLMCPTCHVPLDQSQSQEAAKIRLFIQRQCAAGWSEQRVKKSLVAQFGEAILAAPPMRGFDALAWALPGAVLLGGAAVCATLALAWSRRRRRAAPAAADEPSPLDPATARRIDADLKEFPP